MGFVIVWILFGIVTAVAASNKGRSGWGWFFIGVLLGPFGLILALVILASESDYRCKPAISWPDEKVSELLRTYPSRGNQVRILWNLRVITDEEGRNYHVSRETLTAL